MHRHKVWIDRPGHFETSGLEVVSSLQSEHYSPDQAVQAPSF